MWKSFRQRFTLPLFGMVALSSLGGVAHAQAGAVSGGVLPLANVGNGYRWVTVGETYTFEVKASQAGKAINLEVYSPGLNLNDYVNGRATVGYWGDEIYGRNKPFTSSFLLTNSKGERVFERRYRNTLKHTWEILSQDKLTEGTYTLKVSSDGTGKNAYSMRFNGTGITLSATQFTLNARGKYGKDQLAATFRLDQNWLNKTLQISNYDADGTSELKLFLIAPQGTRIPLTSSANGESVTDNIKIDQNKLGNWQVMVQVQPSTKQYSNAFNLKIGGDPQNPVPPSSVAEFSPTDAVTPVLTSTNPPEQVKTPVVTVVDTKGQPIQGASYIIETTSGGNYTITPVLPSTHSAEKATVAPGSNPTVTVVNPSTVTGSGAATVQFVAKPNDAKLTVDSVAIIGNSRVPLTNIPFQVNGQTYRTPYSLQINPGQYPITPTQVQGSSVQPVSATVVMDKDNKATIEYNVATELRLYTTPNTVDFCKLSQVTAAATTLFPYPIRTGLKVELPRGITTNGALQTNGDLYAGNPLMLNMVVRGCAGGTIFATLEGTGLKTENVIQVRELTLMGSRVVPNSAVKIKKTITYDGNAFVVNLSVAVDRPVKNLRIIDPQPSGNVARSPIMVNGAVGQNIPTDGNTIFLGNLNQGVYNLSYQIYSAIEPERLLVEPDLQWDDQ